MSNSIQSSTLMLQGTASDAGKSTLVAALCRVLTNRGYKVAPFKPQNMALNSAVTSNGKEIGRAQAVQAMACKVDPTEHMNPVLLKPNSDIGAQVIIHGKALSNMDAVDYHDYKTTAMNAVLESHQKLEQNYNYIIVEGAGSPAEINLRDKDIANMGFAEAVDCPVILVADIDKGGVFAQIIGTLELLSESERERTVGFIINKFRGDIALLKDGLEWLEDKTGKPVFGVMPYLHDLYIEAEDSIDTQQNNSETKLNIIVPVLSRISNHTDFDVLRLHPDINLQFVPVDTPPPACDLIILPGTKNVIADLVLLKNNGWAKHIEKHLRYGGKLLGICGGMQMLGKQIFDPEQVESNTKKIGGFALADLTTHLEPEKILQQRKGRLLFSDAEVSGYEIHAGVSTGTAFNQPLVYFDNEHTDGFVSSDNQVCGSYLHGLFDSPVACNAFLKWAGLENTSPFNLTTFREQQFDYLAETFTQHINIEKILAHLK